MGLSESSNIRKSESSNIGVFLEPIYSLYSIQDTSHVLPISTAVGSSTSPTSPRLQFAVPLTTQSPVVGGASCWHCGPSVYQEFLVHNGPRFLGIKFKDGGSTMDSLGTSSYHFKFT